VAKAGRRLAAMSSEPLNPGATAAAERRPAVWPWLLVPLLALALFVALSKFKESRLPATQGDSGAPAAEESASPADRS
jgi:hypothetical protein